MASAAQYEDGYDVPIELHPHTMELAGILLHDDGRKARSPESAAHGDHRGDQHGGDRTLERPRQPAPERCEQGGPRPVSGGMWVSPPALAALRDQAKLLQQQKRAKQRQHMTLDVSPGRFELPPVLHERRAGHGEEDRSYQLVGLASADAPTPTYRRGRDGGVQVPLRMMASLLISDGPAAGASTLTHGGAASSGAAAAAAVAGGGEAPRQRDAGSGAQQQQQQRQAEAQEAAGRAGTVEEPRLASSPSERGLPVERERELPGRVESGAATPGPATRSPPPVRERRSGSAPASQPEPQPNAQPPTQTPLNSAKVRSAGPTGLPSSASLPPSRSASAASAASTGEEEAEGAGGDDWGQGQAAPPIRAGRSPAAAAERVSQRSGPQQPQPQPAQERRPPQPPPQLPPQQPQKRPQEALASDAWLTQAAPAAAMAPTRLLQRASVSLEAAGTLLPAPLSAEHAFLHESERQSPPASSALPRQRPLAHHRQPSLPRPPSPPVPPPLVGREQHPQSAQNPQHPRQPQRQQLQPQRPSLHLHHQQQQRPRSQSAGHPAPFELHLTGLLPAPTAAAPAGAGGGGAMEEDDDDADGAMLIDVGSADRTAEGALLPTPERPRSAAAAAAAGGGWDALRGLGLGLGLGPGDSGDGGAGGGIAATLALLSHGGGAAGGSPDSGWQQGRGSGDERMAEEEPAGWAEEAAAEAEATARGERGARAQRPGEGEAAEAGARGGAAGAGGEGDEGFDADDEGEEGRLHARAGRVLRLKGRSGTFRQLPGLSSPPPWSPFPSSAPSASASASASAGLERLALAGFSSLALSPATPAPPPALGPGTAGGVGAGRAGASGAPPPPGRDVGSSGLEELLRLKVSLRRALGGGGASSSGSASGGGSPQAVALILSLLAALPASPADLTASQVAPLVAPLQQHACAQVAAAARLVMAVWKTALKAAARQPAAPVQPRQAPPFAPPGSRGSGGGAGPPGTSSLPPPPPPRQEPHNLGPGQAGLQSPPLVQGSLCGLARSHSDALVDGRFTAGASASGGGPGFNGAGGSAPAAAPDLLLAAEELAAERRQYTESAATGAGGRQRRGSGGEGSGAAGGLEDGEGRGGGARGSNGSGVVTSGTTLSCSPTAAGAGAGAAVGTAAGPGADGLEPPPRVRLGSTGTTGTTAGGRQPPPDAAEGPVPAAATAPSAIEAARPTPGGVRSYSPRVLGLRSGGGEGCLDGSGGRENGGCAGGCVGGPARQRPLEGPGAAAADGALQQCFLGEAPSHAAAAVGGGSGGGNGAGVAVMGAPAAGLLLLQPPLAPPGRKRKGERPVSRRGGGNPSKRAAAAGPPGHFAGPRPVPPGLQLTPLADPASCASDDQRRVSPRPVHLPAPAAGHSAKAARRGGPGGLHAPVTKRQRHHSAAGGVGGGGGTPHGAAAAGGGGGHHTAAKVRRVSLLLSSLDLGGGGGEQAKGALLAELEQDADADMGSQDEEAAMLTSEDDGGSHSLPGSGANAITGVGLAALCPGAGEGSRGGGGGDSGVGRDGPLRGPTPPPTLAHGGYFGGTPVASGGNTSGSGGPGTSLPLHGAVATAARRPTDLPRTTFSGQLSRPTSEPAAAAALGYKAAPAASGPRGLPLSTSLEVGSPGGSGPGPAADGSLPVAAPSVPLWPPRGGGASYAGLEGSGGGAGTGAAAGGGGGGAGGGGVPGPGSGPGGATAQLGSYVAT